MLDALASEAAICINVAHELSPAVRLNGL